LGSGTGEVPARHVLVGARPSLHSAGPRIETPIMPGDISFANILVTSFHVWVDWFFHVLPLSFFCCRENEHSYNQPFLILHFTYITLTVKGVVKSSGDEEL